MPTLISKDSPAERRLGLLKKVLEVLGDGFMSRGGSDYTAWDECHECGKADWDGHKPDCAVGKLVDEVRKEVGCQP